jgi:hypothetical protein
VKSSGSREHIGGQCAGETGANSGEMGGIDDRERTRRPRGMEPFE